MKKGLQVPTVALLTRTIIDKGDPAMKNPTKPIGPFYSKEDAAQHEATWHMKQDSVRGYRRLVPSPLPKLVVERDIIKKLFDAGYIAIHSGGGGIPVVRLDDGTLSGIEAVIDKDLTASLMASYLQVDLLLILTDVEQVYLNYGTKNQIALDKLTVKDCERYQREGQFATGSMAPKIEAARRFVLESPKSRAIISSIKRALEALDGKAGTEIVN
jgi:carbamate kinase